MEIRRIAYTSKAKINFSKRDLLNLLHDSRAFNLLDNITGVLIHKDGCFLQIIEGEPKDVKNLLERLKKDTRHENFKILEDILSETRLFNDWAMGCADFDDPSLSFIPGIRKDLSNPENIKNFTERLPEISTILHENLTHEQIHGLNS